jgi:hypothetical protein
MDEDKEHANGSVHGGTGNGYVACYFGSSQSLRRGSATIAQDTDAPILARCRTPLLLIMLASVETRR